MRMSDREKVINDLQSQIEELEERLVIVLEGQQEKKQEAIEPFHRCIDRDKAIAELQEYHDREGTDERKQGVPARDERRRITGNALDLLKEQEEQKRKWLQTIADTQLAISPTGYESEDELAKRGWEWNGLQMAWEIIAGEERSEHPRLVRCKDCEHSEPWYGDKSRCFLWHETGIDVFNDGFCNYGKRKEGQ